MKAVRIALLLALGCAAWEPAGAAEPLGPLPPIEVYFSPGGNFTKAILRRPGPIVIAPR